MNNKTSYPTNVNQADNQPSSARTNARGVNLHTESFQQHISLPITRLVDGVDLPAYAYPGDAGLDLRAACDMVIQPFERVLIPTGLAIAIPEGFAGFVLPRSGMALKYGLSMANTPGLIDSHYRGELKVVAINLDPQHPITIAQGERIAQLVIMAVPFVSLIEVDHLDETERGSGGFGSSGTQ